MAIEVDMDEAATLEDNEPAGILLEAPDVMIDELPDGGAAGVDEIAAMLL